MDTGRSMEVGRQMTLGPEAFDDVVMPPDDLGQVRSLDGMLHRTNSATLRGANGEEMLLPSEIYEVLLEVVTAMSKGQAISVVPKSQRLTTREAADFLGISRPTLVKLLEGGQIPFEQPSRHRRVLLSDLVAFKQRRRDARRATLAEMTRKAAEQGLYDSTDSPTDVAAALKKARSEVVRSATQ
jgi:excisionase family DNA binding protein